MPTAGDADTSDTDIVVIAERLRGQVDTDVPPVIELDEEDIAAYGAASIADLIEQLAPQTSSGRGRGGGRPVFLVNGMRVSGFREFSRYPPEAIRKVEVLPEEVALKFGYPPDQRVINFILKDNFASKTIEAEYGGPVRGGSATGQLEGSLLRIDGPSRLNLGAEYATTSMLTEAERGVVQTPASLPAGSGNADPAEFRSLIADSQSAKADASWTTGLGDMGSEGQFTINGQVTRSDTRSLSGLDTRLLPDLYAITRRTRTTGYSLGSAFNKPLGDWQLEITANASRTDTDTRIGTPAPVVTAFEDRAQSTVDSLASLATLRGHPLILPGGEVSLTLNSGYTFDRIESDDSRSAAGSATLKRGDLSAGFNVGVPVTSTREGFLDPIGDLSLNISGGIDQLSDFGTLTNWNAGFNWRPFERLSLQASYIVKDVAPGLPQLGNPTVSDFNVPVYDFSNGQTVLATVTTGGNPALVAEKQRDVKLSADYDFDLFDRASFRVEYFRNRSSDVTASFPLLTPAIEAAFPDRVIRNADGTLLALDRRPVTFAEQNSQRIRYGFNLFGRIGKASENEGGESGSGSRRSFGAPSPQPGGGPPPSGDGPPPDAGGAPAQGGTSGDRRDPSRFAAMRESLCGAPSGETPDLSGLPGRMLERLKGEDGQIDPAKVAALRERVCSASGVQPRFDPERFAALRTALGCDDMSKELDVASLPEALLDRLRGTDGQIDPARLQALRERVCAMPAGGPQAAGAQSEGGTDRRGGSGGVGRMPFGRGRDGEGQGRWNLSLYHTIELQNEVLVAPGGPFLDLLDGDALGNGGVSRHKFELEAGVFYKGIGARLSGNYLSGTTVNGSGLPGSSDLHFGDLATFDLRLFVNLEQQKWLTGENPGFWKGSRFSLRVNNLFDAHQRVTDENGLVPLRYQPALIDPVGRFIEVEFRKMF